MKNKISFFVLLSISLFCACGKEEPVIPVPEENNSIYWDDFCSVEEIYWLADNKHIIMNDNCDGTLKKINSISKGVEYIQVQQGENVQQLYVAQGIADSFFYVSHAYIGGGTTLNLYCYNLKTRSTTLIRDGLALNRYGLRSHLFMIHGDPIEIIDLKTGASRFINANGNAGPLSPDRTMMLVYGLTTTQVYDFNCDCTFPSPPRSENGGVIWNNVGMFGFMVTPYDYVTQSSNLQISNFTTGFQLTSIDHYAGGPWSAYNGTQLLVFKFDPDKNEKDGILVAFDCVNHTTRDILISESDHLIRGIGRNQVSVSPDQSKIAYVELGLSIKVAPLN